VGVPMSRYLSSRSCLWTGLGACAMAAFAAWAAWGWQPALIGSVPLAAAGLALCYLGLRPPIELCADHLRIGRRAIRWTDIKHVDRLYLRFPLLVSLRLTTGRRVLLVFSGDRESANSLLRNIRRMAKAAFIEGRPYREFWGEALPAVKERRRLTPQRCRLLLPQDEAEVERLYQQLKAAGRIDSKSSADET
jgi:hypothetical protein